MAASMRFRKYSLLYNILQISKRQRSMYLRSWSLYQVTSKSNVNLSYGAVKTCNQVSLTNAKFYSSSKLCWKCNKPVSRLSYGEYTCECGVLQPPNENTTYFEVMDEHQTYVIDQTALTQKFRELQSRLHPDKFSQRSEQEQEHSRMHSTLVNKAYRTLQDPLSRALYLLDLHGESVEEDNKLVDQEFLMEIMELNEEVAEIDNAEKFNAVLNKNNESLDMLFERLGTAFRNNQIQRAKSIVIRLKYFSNLQNKLREQRHLYDFS